MLSIQWDKKAVDEFFRFVSERQNIWRKKEELRMPPPWTNDPILQSFHFCNVFRRLDRGTIYALDYILNWPSLVDVLFNTVVYRLFNKPETAGMIGFSSIDQFDWRSVSKKLMGAYDIGIKIFNPSYLTSAAGCGNGHGSKIKAYCKSISDSRSLVKDISKNIAVLNFRDAHEEVTRIKYVGGFIGYQVVLDLSYTKFFEHWVMNEWAYIGPGAARGLNRLVTNPSKDVKTYKYTDEFYQDVLRHLYKHQFRKLDEDFRCHGYDWNVNEIEFSACEFNKYMRVKSGAAMPHVRRRISGRGSG